MINPHIVRKTTSPTAAPPEAGIHWINTVTNQEYFSVGTSSVSDWVLRGAGSVNDATTTIKGIVKLAGDLSGTADLPTVPALANKVDTTRTVSTTAPLSGGGDLSANRTLSISQSGAATDGYLSSVDWSTFNSKQNALGFTPENVANKSTNTALGTSDTLYPTQNAVKTYVDSKHEFSDDTFRIKDQSDPTKKIAFEASSISSGQTRTLTAPNQNGIIALAEDALTPDRVLVSSATGKVNDSIFLKVDEDLDKKILSIGEDITYNYGADIDAPTDDGSVVEYDSSYAYPASADYHEVEVFQYWNLNGVDVVSPFGTVYLYLEADGSENYQLQWEWNDNVSPDGYYLVKYDSSPNSGQYYATIIGNTKNFLEDFTDWSTLDPYSEFSSNPTLIDYGTGKAYSSDNQNHALEVRAFRYVSGIKMWGNSQYFDCEADGSDDYNIQWAWFPVPDIDGYTITKYDDTWGGEYSVDVSTNSFLEDFTDWATKDPTPTFISQVEETEYSFSPYVGLKTKRSSEEKLQIDKDGLFLNGSIPQNRIVTSVNNRLFYSNYSADGSLLSCSGNVNIQSSSNSGQTTIKSGNSELGTGSSSGAIIIESNNASNRTIGTNPPSASNGPITIRTGNGSTNLTSGTNVSGGLVGDIRITGGNGGGAQNGTVQNLGAEAGRILLNGGKGGSTTGPGGSGGFGGSYQMSTGAGGDCTSSAPNQVGSGGSGGAFFAYAGNGGRLFNMNGSTGQAGDMVFTCGIAWASNYAGTASANTGGRGGDVTFRASSGGDASGSTVANNGGRAGRLDFECQRGGDGDTSRGAAGSITFRVGRPGKNSTDTAQGNTGNIIFQPSPAAYTGAAEGVVGLATTTGGIKTGKVAIGHIAPSALLDVSGDTKLGTSGTVFQSVVSATATLDFPNISNNHIQELTMTVTGAQVGGSVHLGAPSTLEANLIAFGFVSATNTVTIRLAHMGGGGGVNPASATWRATVFNF